MVFRRFPHRGAIRHRCRGCPRTPGGVGRHRLGHLGGIACAEGRQGPIVFNGMEMLFSHGATHLFQLNGNVDVDWCEKHISMELKWLRLSVRRIGFNSIEIVAPLLRRILAYPVSLTSREVEPHQKLFAATSLSCLFCKSVFYRKTAGGCRSFFTRLSSRIKKWVYSRDHWEIV